MRRNNAAAGRGGADAHDSSAATPLTRRSTSPSYSSHRHHQQFHRKHAVVLTIVFFVVVYLARTWRSALRSHALKPDQHEVAAGRVEKGSSPSEKQAETTIKPPLPGESLSSSTVWRGRHQILIDDAEGSASIVLCGEGQVFYVDASDDGLGPSAQFLDSEESEQSLSGRDSCCKRCTETDDCNGFILRKKICSLYTAEIDAERAKDRSDSDDSELDTAQLESKERIAVTHKPTASPITEAETNRIERNTAAELGFAVDDEEPPPDSAPVHHDDAIPGGGRDEPLTPDILSLSDEKGQEDELPSLDHTIDSMNPVHESDLDIGLDHTSNTDENFAPQSNLDETKERDALGEEEKVDENDLVILPDIGSDEEPPEDEPIGTVNTPELDEAREGLNLDDQNEDQNEKSAEGLDDLLKVLDDEGIPARSSKSLDGDVDSNSVLSVEENHMELLDLDDHSDENPLRKLEFEEQPSDSNSRPGLRGSLSSKTLDDIESHRVPAHDESLMKAFDDDNDLFKFNDDLEDKRENQPKTDLDQLLSDLDGDDDEIFEGPKKKLHLQKPAFDDEESFGAPSKRTIIEAPGFDDDAFGEHVRQSSDRNPVFDADEGFEAGPLEDDQASSEREKKKQVKEPQRPAAAKIPQKSILDLALEGKSSEEQRHSSLDDLLQETDDGDDSDLFFTDLARKEGPLFEETTKATLTTRPRAVSDTEPSLDGEASDAGVGSGSNRNQEEELEDVGSLFKSGPGSSEVIMSPEAASKIASTPIRTLLPPGVYTVTVPDPFYQQKIKFFGRFKAASQIFDFLTEWQAEYSKPGPGRSWQVDYFTLGKTGEGKMIKAVEFGNPNRGKHVFIVGGLRGCDWVGPLAITHSIIALVGRKRTTAHLLDSVRFHVIPLVNVDGYHYSRRKSPASARHWCDNRRISGGGHGVNLERNFGEDGQNWGFGKRGKDGRKDKHGFQGLSGFSEPETQVVKQYIEHYMTGSGRVAVLHVRCCGGTITPPQLFGERAKDSTAAAAIYQGSTQIANNIRASGEGQEYSLVKRPEAFSADNTGQLIDWTASIGADHSYAFEIKALSVATYNDRYQINPEPFMALCKELEIGMTTITQLLLQQSVQGPAPNPIVYRPRITSSVSSTSSSKATSSTSSKKKK